MADPLGSLEKIVKLALRIKEAVDTVRHNKEECQQIRTRAVRVSTLLSRLPETGIAGDPAMCDALDDLEGALRDAHALVTACQESSTVCLYCAAGKQARRLRRAQDDISQKVMLVVFATNIHTTIILTNAICSRGDPPLPPPAQVNGAMIAQPVVVPSNSSAEDARPGIESPDFDDLYNFFEDSSPERSMRRTAGAETSPNVNLSLEDGIEAHNVPNAIANPREQIPHALRKTASLGLARPYSAGTSNKPIASPTGHAFRRLRAVISLSPPPPSQPVALRCSQAPHVGNGLREFNFTELEAATQQFAVQNMVGSGSFATVYKGVLNDGHLVAVKKFQHPNVLSAGNKNKLHLLSKLQHSNIVTLIGYCGEVLEGAKRFEEGKAGAKQDKGTSYLLVEEYMPNGSLDKTINNGMGLDWSSRFHLMQGVAHGLCYLHEQNVIHLDVKPSNILLDSDMNPKITDFGLSKVLNHNGADFCCDIGNIEGTLGYMPPEYITDGTLSKKHDVYGFGVTLLDTVSSMSRSARATGQASIEWAWQARKQAGGGMMKLLDPSLFDALQLKEIERCVEVGLLCTQFDPADRPDMLDSLEMLRGKKALGTPVRPGYTIDREPADTWLGRWGCLRVRL